MTIETSGAAAPGDHPVRGALEEQVGRVGAEQRPQHPVVGHGGAAALDVFEGGPALDPRFLTLDNVLLQPHHSSGTIETRKAMGQLVRDNLAAHFAGRPLLTPVL